MADFRASAQRLHQRITTWRRDLHGIPETGVDTPQTEAYICAELDKIGVSYRKGLGKHGVVALVEGKHKNRVFAIRADMDGLPIKEETGLPFASQNGCMHACGHDAHAAMGLASVKLLHDVREKIEGSVLVVFQPGEEGCTDGPGGAKRMLDDGAFDDPKPDAMVGLHTGCNEAKGQTWPHHNSRFDIDEDVLWIGPAVMATMAFDWLKKQA